MSTAIVQITEDVYTEELYKYIIKFDGANFMYADGEDEARDIINSIAVQFIEDYKRDNPNNKVFREDLNAGRKVTISEQIPGTLWNSSLHKLLVLEIVRVCHCRFNYDDVNLVAVNYRYPTPSN